MTKPVEYRPMAEAERELARALSGCKFTPASFDKRFARDMRGIAESLTPQVTEKQAALLRRMITRYRRQIQPASIPEPERHLLAKPTTTTTLRAVQAGEA